MTHNGAFHNNAIGGVWALDQLTSNSWTTAKSTAVRQALGFSNMRGFCVRIPWNFVESNTVQGSYSFTVLEQALAVVREFPSAKFAVRPISGRYTPTYIYDTLGARNYTVSGGRAPHPCNTDGTPNTIWLNRFLPFMQALFDWAATKNGDVSYVHGTHFSNQYSEFYHGTEVRSPTTGYDSGNVNFINAHKQLWSGVYSKALAAGIATEFGMSGTHVEDIQIAAVEYIHSISGDWMPYIVINANGVAGATSGGTDWGASTETQQDTNCGFAVNGVFNPPAARRVTRMGQMIQPGNYSATYWHNTFLTTRSNKAEGVEIYLADGTSIGAPGTSFGGSGASALQAEISSWMSEIIGGSGTAVNAVVASTMPHLTSSATAQRWQVATAASTMPSLTASATGIVDPTGTDVVAIASSGMPHLTSSATGERGENQATAASTMPSLRQAATGVRANPTAGTGFADSLMPSLTSMALGQVEFVSGEGAIASVMPALVADATGALAQAAEVQSSLPSLRGDASGSSATKLYIRPVDHVSIIDGPGLILPQPPPERPEGISVGLFSRDGPPAPTGSGSAWGSLSLPGNYVKGFVVNVLWSDLQPDAQDQDFQVDDIDVAIQEATDLGIQLKVRLFFGGNAPSWAKTMAGGPMTLNNPQTPGDIFTCGIFWDASYIAAVGDVYSQFIERYNPYVYPNGPLMDVTVSGAMTRFAEPCLRQNSDPTNQAEFGAHGYTLAKDLACHHAYMDQLQDFKGVAAMAFNAFQVATTHQNLPAISITLMDDIRTRLGLHGGIGNNSDRTDVVNVPPLWPLPGAQKLYDAIASHGAPSYIQTAAEARVGDLYTTCATNVARGVTMIEMPSNFTQDGIKGMTPTQFDTINQGLADNATAAGF